MDDTQTATTTDGGKKKKDKMRSAWISFGGRIVAQLVGAVATVALGVMVLHRYAALDSRPVQPVQPGQPAVTVIVISPEMLALRDADQRFRPADRGCLAELDRPSTPTAHFDRGTLLPR